MSTMTSYATIDEVPEQDDEQTAIDSARAAYDRTFYAMKAAPQFDVNMTDADYSARMSAITEWGNAHDALRAMLLKKAEKMLGSIDATLTETKTAQASSMILKIIRDCKLTAAATAAAAAFVADEDDYSAFESALDDVFYSIDADEDRLMMYANASEFTNWRYVVETLAA